jgi:chitin-binding protein
MILARVSTALAVPLLLITFTGGPAAAHGAPTNPLSRSSGCEPKGKWVRSAACVAAIAASGQVDWDNLRVADVDGRDKQRIPDGKLCSAGLNRFRGLDLPRADWQTTSLPGGGQVTFSYRGTIPHAGTFRWYITREGYSPTRPLRWADLDDAPFLTVKDPPLRNGSYVMTGRLPAGRTGRHLIYTVWQTRPDTYYSCSDVVLTGAPPSPSATGGAQPDTAAAPATGTPAGSTPAETEQAEVAVEPVAVPVSNSRRALPWVFAAGSVLALAAAAAAFLLARRRRT